MSAAQSSCLSPSLSYEHLPEAKPRKQHSGDHESLIEELSTFFELDQSSRVKQFSTPIPQQHQQEKERHVQLFIANLHPEVSHTELMRAVEAFGPTKSVVFNVDPATNLPTGHASVTYNFASSALNALQRLNQVPIRGRRLICLPKKQARQFLDSALGAMTFQGLPREKTLQLFYFLEHCGPILGFTSFGPQEHRVDFLLRPHAVRAQKAALERGVPCFLLVEKLGSGPSPQKPRQVETPRQVLVPSEFARRAQAVNQQQQNAQVDALMAQLTQHDENFEEQKQLHKQPQGPEEDRNDDSPVGVAGGVHKVYIRIPDASTGRVVSVQAFEVLITEAPLSWKWQDLVRFLSSFGELVDFYADDDVAHVLFANRQAAEGLVACAAKNIPAS